MLRSGIRSDFVVMLAVIGAVAYAGSGCGNGGEVVRMSLKEVDRKVESLRWGSSVSVVRSQLGPPVSEVSQGNQLALNYGKWQLKFVDSHLEERSRVRVYRHGGHPPAGLLKKRVPNLALGMTVREVDRSLGMPEVRYEVFSNEVTPVVIQRYGMWELTFKHSRLTQRSQ
jgi:hypothetical protein